MDLEFLNDVDMKELEGKNEIVKSVRFSKEEFYMLKYCKYKNKKFATYVKELIDADIKNQNSTIERIKDEIKEDLLKELKLNLYSLHDIDEKKNDTIVVEGRDELMDMFNNRR